MYKKHGKFSKFKKNKSWNLGQFISKLHNNTKFHPPNKKVVFCSEKYDQKIMSNMCIKTFIGFFLRL
jgi:hypothetical protein